MSRLSASLLAALAVLTGCAATTPPPYAGCMTWDQQQLYGSAPPGASVLSPELAKVVGVQGVTPSMTQTGLAAVQVSVYNCTDADVVLLMRSRFSGGRGQAEAPSAWRTVHLAPRAIVTYGESAVNPQTSGIAVDIYDANRSQQQFAPGQAYPAAPPR